MRAPLPEESEQVLHVLCAAFRLRVDAARPIFTDDPFYDLSHKRILTSPATGAVASLTVVPSMLHIGSAAIPFGGIAGVATAPEHQRQGHAGRLLQETIRSLAHDLHYPISGLFTELPDYYRRFGWEHATRAYVFNAPIGALPRFADGDRVRIASPDDLAAQLSLEALHRLSLSQRASGAFDRDTRRWTVIRRYIPGCRAAVFERESGAAGYLIFEETSELLRVHEMFGIDHGAERALIGFLACREVRQMEWAASLSDIQRFGLHEYTQAAEPPKMAAQPDMMVRITNVPAVLCIAHAANFSPILSRIQRTLTVIIENDVIVPENASLLRITSRGVEPGARSDADWVAMDIAAFGQLFLGYHDASTMQAFLRLKASGPEALATADLLFPARDPFVALPDRF